MPPYLTSNSLFVIYPMCQESIAVTLAREIQQMEGMKCYRYVKCHRFEMFTEAPPPVMSKTRAPCSYLCRSKRQYTAGGASLSPSALQCPPTYLSSIQRHMDAGWCICLHSPVPRSLDGPIFPSHQSAIVRCDSTKPANDLAARTPI